MVELGLYLKRKRERMRPKVSQNEVGAAMGWVNGQLVSNWERGEQAPPINSLMTLAKMYDIPRKIICARYLQYKKRQLDQLVARGVNEQSLLMRYNRKRS